MPITSSNMVAFTNIPQGGTAEVPLFNVGGTLSSPRRCLLMSGTVSNATPDPNWGQIMLQLVLVRPGMPDMTVWNEPPHTVIFDLGGEPGHELKYTSAWLHALVPGSYHLRITLSGAACLRDNVASAGDSFFVVAIDMDDNVSAKAQHRPTRNKPTLSRGTRRSGVIRKQQK